MRRSPPKYAKRIDSTQGAIIDLLTQAGFEVLNTQQPVDIAFRHPSWPQNVFRWMELKSPANKANAPSLDKRQKAQAEFCRKHHVPYCVTPEQALAYARSFSP